MTGAALVTCCVTVCVGLYLGLASQGRVFWAWIFCSVLHVLVWASCRCSGSEDMHVRLFGDSNLALRIWNKVHCSAYVFKSKHENLYSSPKEVNSNINEINKNIPTSADVNPTSQISCYFTCMVSVVIVILIHFFLFTSFVSISNSVKRVHACLCFFLAPMQLCTVLSRTDDKLQTKPWRCLHSHKIKRLVNSFTRQCSHVSLCCGPDGSPDRIKQWCEPKYIFCIF